MDQNALKQLVAEKALSSISKGELFGVGTSSTVDCLIALWPAIRQQINVVVSSSKQSTQQLTHLDFDATLLTEVVQ